MQHLAFRDDELDFNNQIKAFWPECVNVEFGSVNSNVLNDFSSMVSWNILRSEILTGM